MYRVDSKNADALGKKIESDFTLAENEDATLEDRIWNLLRSCYDPEIPVNIVDLGLIYGVDIEETKKDRFNIKIRMTLTAPGCGMGPIIAEDAKTKVLSLPEVEDVKIETVFDPPWDRSMMSEQAKLELGML
jgi:probable FeS assembly SUF system protein SufT